MHPNGLFLLTVGLCSFAVVCVAAGFLAVKAWRLLKRGIRISRVAGPLAADLAMRAEQLAKLVEPPGILVEVSGQRVFGVRGREGAGHPSLDPVEAGREPQRFFRGGSLPSQKLCPRRPALEFRNHSVRVSRDGNGNRAVRL